MLVCICNNWYVLMHVVYWAFQNSFSVCRLGVIDLMDCFFVRFVWMRGIRFLSAGCCLLATLPCLPPTTNPLTSKALRKVNKTLFENIRKLRGPDEKLYETQAYLWLMDVCVCFRGLRNVPFKTELTWILQFPSNNINFKI